MEHVIQQLKQEHLHSGRLACLIDSQLALFHVAERPDYDLLLDAMEYMTHYPDVFHHPKEDVLFRQLMLKAPSLRPLADRLLAEHQALWQAGADFLVSLQAVVDGQILPREEIERRGRDYIALLYRHMQAEEREVFPQALEVLDQHDWEFIDKAVGRIEDPVFGGMPPGPKFRRLYEILFGDGAIRND